MKIGDRATVTFREHSIPTTATGTVIRVEHGCTYVTIRADAWRGESGGNLVCVPSYDAVILPKPADEETKP